MRRSLIIGLLFAATTAFAQNPATPGATSETPAACHQAFSKRAEDVITWRGYVMLNAKLPKGTRDEGAMRLLQKGTIQNMFYSTRMTLACSRHDFEAYSAVYHSLRNEPPTTTLASAKDWDRRAAILDGRFVRWLFAAGDDCITRGYDLSKFTNLIVSGLGETEETPNGGPAAIEEIANWFRLRDDPPEYGPPPIPHCGRQ